MLDNFLGFEELGRFSFIFSLLVGAEILLFFALSENCVKARLVFGEPISCKFGWPGVCNTWVNGLFLQTYL